MKNRAFQTSKKIPLFLVLLPLLFSCSEKDNGRLRVINHTQYNIVVTYRTAVEKYDNFTNDESEIVVEQRSVNLDPGEERVIYTVSNFWDGEVTVEMAGLVQVYDIDFDIIDKAHLHIYEEDFTEEI